MPLNNKKILMLASTDNMIWQFLLPHIERLKQRGNTVECACAKTGFWFDELENEFGLKMHNLSIERKPLKIANLKAYKKLVKIQKENNYDVIYCQQAVGGLLGRLIGKKFKIPILYTAHGFFFFKGCKLKNKILYKTAESWLSKYTQALVVINDEDYVAAKKFKAKKVYKIDGIGIDTKKLKNPEETKKEIRKTLNVKNEFLVTIIAEFIKRKNYLTTIKVAQKLKNENIKFLFCGTGVEKLEMEKLANKLDLDNVSFLGYRKDTNRILKASDTFFLPSFQEGLTLSVMEAMNYGLPCVVSNVRGNKDLIVDGRNGFVAEPKDAEAFANAILKLKNDFLLQKEISANNKKDAKKYLVKNVVKQLDKIYDEFDC